MQQFAELAKVQQYAELARVMRQYELARQADPFGISSKLMKGIANTDRVTKVAAALIGRRKG